MVYKFIKKSISICMITLMAALSFDNIVYADNSVSENGVDFSVSSNTSNECDRYLRHQSYMEGVRLQYPAYDKRYGYHDDGLYAGNCSLVFIQDDHHKGCLQ